MLRVAIIPLLKPLHGSRECHHQKQLLLIVGSKSELVMVMARQYTLITWRHCGDRSRWINNTVRRLGKLAYGAKSVRELISVTGLCNVPWQAQQKLSQHQMRVRSPSKKAQSVMLLTCISLEFRSRHSQSSLRIIFLSHSRQLPGLYLEIKQSTFVFTIISDLIACNIKMDLKERTGFTWLSCGLSWTWFEVG